MGRWLPRRKLSQPDGVHPDGMSRFPLAMILLFLMPAALAAELPLDHIPRSLSLPEAYPKSWVFVLTLPQQDNGMMGAFAIVDVAAGTKEFKGQFQGAFWPVLIAPNTGPELLLAQSYPEHGVQGPRADFLSFISKTTLRTVAETRLSEGKRNLLSGNLVDVTRNGEFLLAMNFTPAASVMVVDRRSRKRLSEVSIPGCTSIYPSGSSGFSSLCQDGTFTTFALGQRGEVIRESRSTPFNDIDRDVLYLEPCTADGVTYFISAKGNVRPVDLTGDEPKVLPTWPLMTAEQWTDGWRTAGGPLVASDSAGHLFVRLYRETGYEKQFRNNTEVWVYDASTQKRVRRIPLRNGGSSIEVTAGEKPLLVVVADSDPAVGESLDVYDTEEGRWLRTIGGWWQGTSLRMVQARR